MRLTNFSFLVSAICFLSIWLRELGIFSGLSLAPLKNLGSWDVHYLGNPITPSRPIQSFHLGNPLPPWTQNPPNGPCNYFAAKALNPIPICSVLWKVQISCKILVVIFSGYLYFFGNTTAPLTPYSTPTPLTQPLSLQSPNFLGQDPQKP